MLRCTIHIMSTYKRVMMIGFVLTVLVGGVGIARSQTVEENQIPPSEDAEIIPLVEIDTVVSESTSSPVVVPQAELATTTASGAEPAVLDAAVTNQPIEAIIAPVVSEVSTFESAIVQQSATNTAPRIILTFTGKKDGLTGTVGLSASADDRETYVSGVQFFLDGVPLTAPQHRPPYGLEEWHSTGTPNGAHVFSIRAYDSDGAESLLEVPVTFANKESDIVLASVAKNEPLYVVQATGGPSGLVSAGVVTAPVQFEYVTRCDSCKEMVPTIPVRMYYTPWYPNDGPSLNQEPMYALYEENIQDIAAVKQRAVSWSASMSAGTYYFVAIVDPDNVFGLRQTHRSMFVAE